MRLELAPVIPPPKSSQKSPRQQHSQLPQQPTSQEALESGPSSSLASNSHFTCLGISIASALRATASTPSASERDSHIHSDSPFAAHLWISLIWFFSSHTSTSRFSSAPSTLGTGRLIAMAGAMKTFWVLLLVVAMAAVAAQAHDGEDHGPAGAPHADAPDVGSAAELLASWLSPLSPLLLAGAAFAASVLRS